MNPAEKLNLLASNKCIRIDESNHRDMAGFMCRIGIAGKVFEGRGATKKAAKNDACEQALCCEEVLSAQGGGDASVTNSTLNLNNYCQKHGVTLHKSCKSSGPSHMPIFLSTLVVTTRDGQVFECEGEGASKRLAENAASKEALIKLGTNDARESVRHDIPSANSSFVPIAPPQPPMQQPPMPSDIQITNFEICTTVKHSHGQSVFKGRGTSAGEAYQDCMRKISEFSEVPHDHRIFWLKCRSLGLRYYVTEDGILAIVDDNKDEGDRTVEVRIRCMADVPLAGMLHLAKEYPSDDDDDDDDE